MKHLIVWMVLVLFIGSLVFAVDEAIFVLIGINNVLFRFLGFVMIGKIVDDLFKKNYQ